MSPLMISAHFAAYIWFMGQPENAGKTAAEAMKFANEEWSTFIQLAHPGLGRLLLKLAASPKAKRRKRRAARVLTGHAPSVLTAGSHKRALPPSAVVNRPFSRN